MVTLPDPQCCKKCGKKGKVINSRTDPRGYRWRRRECLPCNWRWNSYETLVDPRDLPESKIEPQHLDRSLPSSALPHRK